MSTPSRTVARVALALIGAALVVGLGVAGAQQRTDAAAADDAGAPILAAPALTGPLLGSGTAFDSSSIAGRPIVVNFWASWCPPCNDEAPTLAAAYDEWHGQGVAFVGVDAMDDPADGLAFIEHYGWTYPVLDDASGALQSSWNIPGLPVTLFIDRAGNILARHSGAIDEDTLRARIELIAAS